MPYVVVFAGTSAVSPAKPGYLVWTYRVEPVGGGALAPGQLVALALPAGLDIEGPTEWPQLPELGGMFVQNDVGAAQQFVGRAIATAGTQTLSFVAPAASAQCEVQLAIAQSGGTWIINAFSLGPSMPLNMTQVVTGPAVMSPGMVSPGVMSPGAGGLEGLVIDPSIPPAGTSAPPATTPPAPPATPAGAVPPVISTPPATSTPPTTSTPPVASAPPVVGTAPVAGSAGTPAGSPGASTAPPLSGRPIAQFKGKLPYASEMFGVYQPLAGWLGRQNAQRVVSTPAPSSGPVVRLAADTTVPILPASATLAGATDAFTGENARNLRLGNALLTNPGISQLVAKSFGGTSSSDTPAVQGVLSPVGLLNLFREYFFEFDTFLGTPAGHIWISPGGLVEVIEISTRRTIIEKTTEQSETSTRKTEEDLTQQDDIADAVKEDNANDTKLGISASGGASGSLGVATYHAEANASFSTDNSVKSSSEDTHKHSRTQSSKVSSEITRNFKTTFKTVTDNTDTSSRRYVVQNTTDKLVNYELRRKVRKIGVQVQHIGTRLSWQIFVDNPGRDLGLGDLVQVVPAPDLSAIHKPDQPPPLQSRDTPMSAPFPVRKYPGTENDVPVNEDFVFRDANSNDILSYAKNDHMVADAEFSASPPAPGYFLAAVHLNGAASGGHPTKFLAHQPVEILDAGLGRFRILTDFANSGDSNVILLDLTLTWNPPAVDPAQAAYQTALAAYQVQVAQLQQAAYAEAVRTRLDLVSNIGPRPTVDLRSEERHLVYGQLLSLLELSNNAHMDSEFIRQIFDVDDMLYFTAPDYWRPGTTWNPPGAGSLGHYPVPAAPDSTVAPDRSQPLAGATVLSWYSQTDKDNALDPARNVSDEYRVNYLITETTQPAPMGSSLGWLVQIDGDERRNEFLNAAWVKVVLPIRPGHEMDGLAWLAQTAEGEAGLGLPYPMQPGDPASYQGKTVGAVLEILATALQASNTDLSNLLATEKVFEDGFDPLDGGFRPATPYQIFDQWIEILPTDQIAAVEVTYDPKTGLQL